MALEYPPGSTGIKTYWLLRSALFDDLTQGKTGLTAASAGAQASYIREGGTAVTFALTDLAAPDSPWQAGGFKEVGSAAPGIYRLDVPDAAMAVGARSVHFSLHFDNVLIEGQTIQLRNPASVLGPGSVPHTFTVLNSVTSQPIPGAAVWISTDEAGENVVLGALSTNALGQATFMIDPGDYFLWVQAEQYTGPNPTPVTIS